MTLAVGHAICEGRITSIDDVMKKYVPALAGTSWGEATVRDVLKMASGAYRTIIQYNGQKHREFGLVGYGGQYLLFNLATNTVVYHHATTFSSVVWGTPRVLDELIPALTKVATPLRTCCPAVHPS